MSITNGYASLAEVKAALDITDTNDDTKLEGVIEGASRAIDLYTGRFFWVDGSVTVRYYKAKRSGRVYTDDISTATGLIIETDIYGDGTFGNTLAATDYDLIPYNALLDGLAYNGFEKTLLNAYAFPTINRGVRVTAKFGWASVPKTVNTACIIQSERLFKRFDSPLGSMATNALGYVSLKMPELDRDVENLLKPYRRLV